MVGTIQEVPTGQQLERGPHYELLLQLHERQSTQVVLHVISIQDRRQ
jgi:hypothetical protein